MISKVLKRKVIIREYDFERVKNEAFAPLSFMGITDSLYDRADFVPLNRDILEKENLLKVIQNPGKSNPFAPKEIPALFLYNIKDYLYNQRYLDWKVEYDEQGYIWVQAKKNAPRTRLGWGIFEKDTGKR